MNSKNRSFLFVTASVFALAGALVLHGCESPTAPKFPPPVEEEPTDTMDEEGGGGLRRRAAQTRDGVAVQRRAEFVVKPLCTERPSCGH